MFSEYIFNFRFVVYELVVYDDNIIHLSKSLNFLLDNGKSGKGNSLYGSRLGRRLTDTHKFYGGGESDKIDDVYIS